MDYSNIEIQEHSTPARLQLTVNGFDCFIEIESKNGKMVFLHTLVHPSLKGMGVGSALVEKSLQFAKDKGWQVKASCPFVAAYIARHPQWSSMASN